MLIYSEREKERERERTQAGGAEREGERENPKQAPCYQCRTQRGAQPHKL